MFNCFHCGNDYDEELLGWADERGEACDYCEHEVTDTCGICGETCPDYETGLVVMIMPCDEAADPEDEPDDGAALRPGVYLVLEWPIYSQPLVGRGYVHSNTLQRIAGIPAKAHAIKEGTTIGQHLCHGCARPYVLAACLPIQETRHGWQAAGRTFARRELAEAWRDAKVDRRMALMLDRLRYRWNAKKCPAITRSQRRWLHRYRKRNGRDAA